MIFELPLRTRGTDCGPDRWVTLPAIISYMEHCRWEWMRVPELGLLDAVHDGYGFFVLNQSIAMSRRFGQGQQTRVGCVLRKLGRSVAEGDQDVVREDGVLLARCTIRGAWMAPSGRLAKIPKQARESVSEIGVMSHFGEAEDGDPGSLFGPPEPLRIQEADLVIPDELPGDASAIHRRTLVVRATDCDIFRHVNAANYVRFIADSLAVQGASASLYRAELHYKGQALAGDEIKVLTWALGDDCWASVIQRGDEVLFRAAVQTEASNVRGY
ncbi:MAG: hypothetical protein GWP91_14430 [Rhodobacterales bacterium]|nr:hypothetical protein [Rhodobacterales bacterium]